MLSYEECGQELARRIEAIIPKNQSILQMESPWGLFKVPGFKSDDLQPTLAMASVALAIAKRRYNEKGKG